MAMVPQAPSEDASYYELLGVDDEADLEALTVAYRQRALAEHPDKGGDAARFHEIARAFKVLSDPEARREYDEKLAKAEERAQLVEGGPAKGAAGMSAKQAQAPMARQKTAPMPGSKRQAKMRCGQPGNYNACAEEWKNMGSAFRVLMAITDDVTPEQKTEELMDKYAALPRGKDKKREWVNGLRGKDKQDLKISAKKREEAARAKLVNSWLNPAAQAAKAGNKAVLRRPAPKKAASPADARGGLTDTQEPARDGTPDANEVARATCVAEVEGRGDVDQASVTA
mmetsp:Transcript_30095/g.78803  ORF Transcript_30095/g.78803 Transcript_30095/m.78803 type:complete len:284 (-) Transcript_30095:99-950(-)